MTEIYELNDVLSDLETQGGYFIDIVSMFNGHITPDLNQNQSIKNVFLLYNGASEQYHDQKVLEQIKTLVPDQILQLDNETTKSNPCWNRSKMIL
jgi:hypothetical protein